MKKQIENQKARSCLLQQKKEFHFSKFNKKGQILSETTMIGWRIFLIAAIVFFIAITVGRVFISKQDIRQAEAVLISDNIIKCITNNNQLIKSAFSLDSCINGNEYYINASLKSIDSAFNKTVLYGDSLEIQCALLEKKIKMKNYPSCLRQKYYVLIDNNGKTEKGVLDLLVGIKKYSENV